MTTLRKSGLLGQHGEGLGGGVGGVKLQSREHWAVATLQLIDFGFELFLGVCFVEKSFLRSNGRAAEQLVVGEVQDWES